MACEACVIYKVKKILDMLSERLIFSLKASIEDKLKFKEIMNEKCNQCPTRETKP